MVFPGDCVELTCEANEIIISGSNAEGHTCYMNNYVSRGLGHYAKILRQYVTMPVNYDSLYYYYRQELIAPYETELKKMEQSENITPAFSAIMAKNLYFACSRMLRDLYNNLFLGREHNFRDFIPSEEDVRTALEQLSQIFETPYATSNEVVRLMFYDELY